MTDSCASSAEKPASEPKRRWTTSNSEDVKPLTGTWRALEVERYCVVDLGRDWRMIVAFPQADAVVVVLVGRHLDRHPEVDVYRRLYDSLGVELPTAAERRGASAVLSDG